MFIIIGIMLTGMLIGYLLRSKRLTWIHKIITFLIWTLLFSWELMSEETKRLLKDCIHWGWKPLSSHWEQSLEARCVHGDCGTYYI